MSVPGADRPRASPDDERRRESSKAQELRPESSLALYPHRFVWPPRFQDTYEWEVLRTDIAAHGIRSPLRILKNGWVIDGTHRLLIARELGLEMLPVQVVSIPLPLSDADRLRIERTAVLETIGRRQLTRHQMDVLFLRLADACDSTVGDAATRLARRRANLAKGSRPAPTSPSIDELARLYKTHPWRIRQLLVLAERGDQPVKAAFEAGTLSLHQAYKRSRPGREDPDLGAVGRYLDERARFLTELMECWADCPGPDREQFLDRLVAWMGTFRERAEALDARAGNPHGPVAPRSRHDTMPGPAGE